MLHLKHTFLLIGSLFFLIVSCGGGGGGGGSPAVPASSGGGSTPAPISGSTQAIALTFSASSSDVELNGSVTLTWAGTNATSCDASGAWGGNNKAASGTETVNLPNIGTQTFSIVCKNSADSVAASAAVEVYQIIGGTVLDGYIRGAEVFVDRNNNFILDTNEPSVTTDNNGAFANLRMYDGQLVAKNGTDLDTGFLFNNFTLKTKLTTDSLDYIISPVTSVGASLTNPADVNKIFGISSDIDVYSVDPIPLIDDAKYATLYSIGNKLTVLAMSIQKFEDTNKDLNSYLDFIAAEAQTSYDASTVSVQMDDPDFVRSVLNTALGTSTADDFKSNLSTMLSNSLYLLQVKDNSAATTGIQNFAFTTLQEDITKLKNCSSASSCAVTNNYTNDVFGYVAGDQNLALSDVTIPIQAFDDVLEVNEDTELSFLQATLLVNDNYLKGTGNTFVFTDAVNGSFLSADAGSFRYLPNLNFNGADTFSYTIGQAGEESTGTVTINVAPVNDNPTVIARSFLNDGGGTSVFSNVGANDIDGDALSYTIGGTDAQYISVAGNGDLSFTNAVSYASPSDGNGDNIYEFTVAVSDGGTSVTQSFQVEVLPGGSAPVFSSWGPIPTRFNENASIIIQIIAADPDGDPMTLSLTNLSGDTSVVNAFSISQTSNGFEISNPSGLASGNYVLQGVITDTNSGKTTPFGVEIKIIALGWQQLGADIDGLSQADNSGYAVDISVGEANGIIAAIGSPGASPDSSTSAWGSVRVLRKVNANADWEQFGYFEGEGAGDSFGRAVKLSSDGTIIAIGAPYNNPTDISDNAAGHVRVFNWTGGDQWVQLGTDIDGENQGDQSGDRIALSADGKTLAVAEPFYDSNTGRVRVYRYEGNSDWVQLGSSIIGERTDDNFGSGLAMNASGTRIIIGARGDDSNATAGGEVKVYEFNAASEWEQFGGDLGSGNVSPNDLFGSGVSMNAVGDVIAAVSVDGTGKGVSTGYVKIYRYTAYGWSEPYEIEGDAAGDQQSSEGRHIDLSDDGDRIIIGASGSNAFAEMAGSTKVFDYNSSTNEWTMLGDELFGEAFKDRSGFSTAITSDGNKVVIGALCNDGDTGNNVDCRGHARVYEYIE